MKTAAFVPLARVVRGSTTESVHLGAVALTDTEGRVLWSAGPADFRTFPRSALKPFQLLALVGRERDAPPLTDMELAVAAGSHAGQPFHLRAVDGLLAHAHVDEHALECGAHPPLNDDAAHMLRLIGAPPSAIHNQCSGQHAAMLLLARELKTTTAGYTSKAHPVQVALRQIVFEMLGVKRAASAIDGCGAPAYALTLRQVSTAYARLARPGSYPRFREGLERIGSAMVRQPECVGGSDGRLDTELMQVGRGLVAKVGSEGFFAVGHPDGLGLVVKLADGDAGGRAVRPVVLAVLEALGWIDGTLSAVPNGRNVASRTLLRNWRGETIGRIEPIAARMLDLPGPWAAVPGVMSSARGAGSRPQ